VTYSTCQFNPKTNLNFISGETMNAFEILVRIVAALILLYILWHGYVVIVAYRWKQEDKLISRALAPRDEL
jgi:hypothetical protein